MEDDALMTELEQILSFAIPTLRNTLNQGRGLYEQVEEQLQVEPIGICPLYADDGYLLITERTKKTTQVYQYRGLAYARLGSRSDAYILIKVPAAMRLATLAELPEG